jgi:hypothetical protein
MLPVKRSKLQRKGLRRLIAHCTVVTGVASTFMRINILKRIPGKYSAACEQKSAGKTGALYSI